MLKGLAIAGVLAMAFTAVAQDKVKLPAAKVGDKSKLKVEMTFEVAGVAASMNANVNQSVKKVEKGAIETVSDWQDFKLVVDGNPMDLPFEPVKVISGTDGSIKEISGGITGSDPIKTQLLYIFFAPDKDLAKAEKWTKEFKKNDKGIPEFKLETVYEGTEEVGGKKAHKFLQKLKEVGGDELSSDTTFWVLEDGTIVKIDSKYKNLFVPQANDRATGTIKAEAIS